MIRKMLSLLVVFFWLSSSSYSQEFNPQGTTSYTYDGTLTQDDIDQSVLYGSPNDIDLMDEGLTYMDQIIDNEVIPYTGGTGREWQATLGCLNASTGNDGDGSWAGTSGGSCANIGTNGDGAIRFGYNQTIVAQTQSAIAEALKIAGITVVGYRWQWKVKNYNANYLDANQINKQDPLLVRVITKDQQGNVLDEREWDYSYSISQWEQKYGMAWYDPFISGDKIDTITIEVEGKDAGFWAGYYGPEFREAGIYTLMVVEPQNSCDTIPVVDPTCPGFIGEAPSEDPAVKELVIIESTGSIPLSEDELAVLESLEEEEETFEEEQIAQPTEDNQEKESNVDALAVARNAEANALSDAQSTIENTLAATENALQQDIQQSQLINEQSMQQSEAAEQISQQSLQQSMQSMQQAMSSQQSTTDTQIDTSTSEILEVTVDIDTSDTSTSTILTTNDNNQQTSYQDSTQSTDQQQSNDSSFNNEIVFEDTSSQQQEPMIELEIVVDTFEIAALDTAINDAVMNLIKMEQNIVREQVEESQQEEELNEPISNEQEDELVAAALAGSDDEDAQAALLGYNPNFRAYQQPQMTDAEFYQPKDIYAGQENYDNPNARLFNGASDATHREMVRQQYEGN